MEIERKYLISELPESLYEYPHKKYEQGYLCVAPVIRIRQEGDQFFLTYKSGGMMAREEYNLPLDEASYLHLRDKVDHKLVHKTRYFIPLPCEGRDRPYTIELDVFEGCLSPLVMAEVEFDSIEESDSFLPPDWFGREVTYDPKYHNSQLCRLRYSDL